ncbi:MAG: hypothetical protein LBG77_05050 [Dysgonamonadaceae bacterium]|nr:hypothetical protein [Dysgonamonadaceae bacterium]
MNIGHNTQKQTTYIPSRMYRSVGMDICLSNLHPYGMQKMLIGYYTLHGMVLCNVFASVSEAIQ